MPAFWRVCRTVLNLNLYRTATWFEPVMGRPEHAVKPFPVFPTWFTLAFRLCARQETKAAQKQIVGCPLFSRSWFASKIPAYFIAAAQKGWQSFRRALQTFSSQAVPEASLEIRQSSSSITNFVSGTFLRGGVRTFWPPLSFWTPWNEVNTQWKKTTVFRRKTVMEQIEFDYPAAKRR